MTKEHAVSDARKVIELRTERLHLRPIKMKDSGAFLDIFSDAEVLRYRTQIAWPVKSPCFNSAIRTGAPRSDISSTGGNGARGT